MGNEAKDDTSKQFWALNGNFVCQWNWKGTAVAQWLRCCATNRKVAGSIPDGATGIVH